MLENEFAQNICGNIYIVTCRPIARERVGKHVSVEIDSWKPTRRRVINRRFLGYGNEDVFFVGPSRCY
jgi:hypothetical protein